MRVTSNTFPNSLVDQLGQLAGRQNRLQNQAATGQRLHSAEDDPAAMRRVLDLQAESQKIAQYQRNINRQRELGEATYGVMRSLKKVSDRAGEMAVLADGLKSPEQMAIFANEINQLIKQAVQVLNTLNRGDYLFGGTRTDRPPFALTTDADGQVTGVTYEGNSTLAESEIAGGVTLSAQTLGVNSSGSGPRGLIADERVGADFFNHLIALQNHLRAGDVAAIATSDRPQLARDEENIIYHLATNGAIQSRLETSENSASNRVLSLEGLISKEADADLAQTLVRLNETQNAYRAALQSGATIFHQSLLDFLR